MKSFCSVLFICISIGLSSCAHHQEDNRSNLAAYDSLVPPVTIRIADLPDSSKPEKINLAERPKPQKVIIPKSEKNSQYYVDPSGHPVSLLPPSRKVLPALPDKEKHSTKLHERPSISLGEAGLPFSFKFTTDDGLAMNNVSCGATDRRGHLWIGTWGQGISRFDGLHFTNFSIENALPSNLITTIFEDSSRQIWIGTDGQGVCKYDGQQFTQFDTDYGRSNSVLEIKKGSKGKLWILTRANITYYDPDQEKINILDISPFKLQNYRMNCLIENSEGYLWVGTGQGAMCIDPFNGTVIRHLTSEEGFSNNNVNAITEDKDGNIWFATDSGVNCLQLSSGKIRQYISPESTGREVHSITADREGKLWFGFNHNAIQCSLIDDEISQGVLIDYPLEFARLLTIDSLNKIWIGSRNSGLSCLEPPTPGRGSSFLTFSVGQGLPTNAVAGIHQDKKGAYWIFSDELIKFDGHQFSTYAYSQGIPLPPVTFMTNTLSTGSWLGSWASDEVYYFDSDNSETSESLTIYTAEQGFPSSRIPHCTVDKQGNAWFSVWQKGTVYFDGKSLTHYKRNGGLENGMITSIAEDKNGDVWFGTAGNGLVCFRPKAGTFTTIHKPQGLVHPLISCLISDSRSNLWIGTQAGLNMISSSDLDILKHLLNTEPDTLSNFGPLLKSFSTNDGILSNNITNMVEFPHGKIALGSNQGLTIFPIPADTSDQYPRLNDIEIFNAQAGYPVRGLETLSKNSMFVDREGLLWLASNSEKTPLIRFDYDALYRNDRLPILAIEKIRINEEVISFQTLLKKNEQRAADKPRSRPASLTDEFINYGRVLGDKEREAIFTKYEGLKSSGLQDFYPVPNDLELPYQHNRITIEFGTNELLRPQLIDYQYKLEGYDRDWSPAIKKNSATFGNIKEGKYTFWVKARYTGPSIGNANEWTQPISFTFSVLPPWYRSRMAYFVYALGILFSIWRIHLFQRERTLRKERQLSQEKELVHAKEIQKAYLDLEATHADLKATQSQLIHSEKMASLGELTAGIAHEIQNPLNFVNNFSEVNRELIEELKQAVSKNDSEEIQIILKDLSDNEGKVNQHG
ncbi:MAG: hypothetical protein KDC53_14670, partial [Saprospiraceae bacterium]|nr:hypothetical protein [Saprospiraceae bacterium]